MINEKMNDAEQDMLERMRADFGLHQYVPSADDLEKEAADLVSGATEVKVADFPLISFMDDNLIERGFGDELKRSAPMWLPVALSSCFGMG